MTKYKDGSENIEVIEYETRKRRWEMMKKHNNFYTFKARKPLKHYCESAL